MCSSVGGVPLINGIAHSGLSMSMVYDLVSLIVFSCSKTHYVLQ